MHHDQVVTNLCKWLFHQSHEFHHILEDNVPIKIVHLKADTNGQWMKECSCLQCLHLQLQLTQQKKTLHTELDWLPFLHYLKMTMEMSTIQVKPVEMLQRSQHTWQLNAQKRRCSFLDWARTPEHFSIAVRQSLSSSNCTNVVWIRFREWLKKEFLGKTHSRTKSVMIKK